jgi:hypothetical protein
MIHHVWDMAMIVDRTTLMMTYGMKNPLEILKGTHAVVSMKMKDFREKLVQHLISRSREMKVVGNQPDVF